jgi:hypothetical protein
LGNVVAFEAMWREYYEFNTRALKLSFFAESHAFCVILESTEDLASIEAFLATMMESGLIQDAIVAQSQRRRARSGRCARATPSRRCRTS